MKIPYHPVHVAAAATMIALLSACGTIPAHPSTVSSTSGRVVPSNEELARRIDSYFAPLAAASDFSGTIRVERGGEAVLVRHYGFADWNGRIPHQESTRYSAASVTKSLTAAALISLEDDGTISLDDTAGRWLPALRSYPEITLRSVLQHRAGLPRDLPDQFDVSADSVAAWLGAHPEQMKPAEEKSYSNVGYALLAEVISAAAKAPFAQVVRQRVLVPAGMDESIILLATAEHFPGGASPYTAGPSPDNVLRPVPATLEIGSSGLVATAADLARWARNLANGAYPELFESDDPLGSIDAGSDANGSYISVQGTLPGYAANAIAWRDHDLTISYTGNLFSYPVLNLGETLRALLGDAPPGPPQPRSPAVRLSETHRMLANTYRHPAFGPISIAHDATQGGMMLAMPEKPAFWTFYLTPIAGGRLHWRAFDMIIARDEADGTATMMQRMGEKDSAVRLRPLDGEMD